MGNYEVLIYGFIIAITIILIWLYYAYTYKTSVTRLSRLAGQRYLMIVSSTIQDQYVIQCDDQLSSYNESDQTFTAVIKFTPDYKHPKAPPIKNVVKKYDVVFDDLNCNTDNLAQYIGCLNVNE